MSSVPSCHESGGKLVNEYDGGRALKMTEAAVDDFERHRDHLRAVAFHILGSLSDAEDAVQEAWLRMQRSDVTAIRNLRGWLTTVVARICLDMLRARSTRREVVLEDTAGDLLAVSSGPEEEAVLADSVGVALTVILQTLSPAERPALVLRDMFGLPFAEIGPIVQRSPMLLHSWPPGLVVACVEAARRPAATWQCNDGWWRRS